MRHAAKSALYTVKKTSSHTSSNHDTPVCCQRHTQGAVDGCVSYTVAPLKETAAVDAHAANLGVLLRPFDAGFWNRVRTILRSSPVFCLSPLYSCLEYWSSILRRCQSINLVRFFLPTHSNTAVHLRMEVTATIFSFCDFISTGGVPCP